MKILTLVKISAYNKDIINILRHGCDAPLRYERIYINPCEVKKRIVGKEYGGSAYVYVDKWPKQKEKEIMIGTSYKIIKEKYEKNLTWEKSGYIEARKKMIKKGVILDGIDTESKIIERCRVWDKIYKYAKEEGRLKTQKELNSKAFRERGGIMISISDNGELVKTGQGNHRLLIAQLLKLPLIPAQIGIVHIKSLKKFRSLREQKKRIEL